MKEFLKRYYGAWIVIFLIISFISYLYVINNKVNWLYNYDRSGDTVSAEFSIIKLLIFIIVNIFISYLIFYTLASFKIKKNNQPK